MLAVGILAFILVDVMAHAIEIVESAVDSYKEDQGSLGHAIALALALGVGFAIGSAGIGTVERRLRRLRPMPPIAGGAVDVAEFGTAEAELRDLARARALQTGMTIAIAIGLHNFAEGLAIGVSASAGEIGLATVLIVGFALHNTTEGLAIVAPVAKEGSARLRTLVLLGLIAGAPAVLGAWIGASFFHPSIAAVMFGIGAGAIAQVIVQIAPALREKGGPLLNPLSSGGLLAGLVVMYLTGLLVSV
jgi:zinc transporter ZupT